MDFNRFIDFENIQCGSITVNKDLQRQIFYEINRQASILLNEHIEPKFVIMNKIAYQQYYAWCVEHSRIVRNEIMDFQIVLDWTSSDLIKVKGSAFDEWRMLDLMDMESR